MNWKEIVKTKCAAACSPSVLAQGLPAWRKAAGEAESVWMNAVKYGWDSTEMVWGDTEEDRFNNYMNDLINEGW